MKQFTLMFSSLFLVLFFCVQAVAQNSVEIKRLDLPVEFDGYPYESAWDNLEYFSLTQNKPNFGAEPLESSEVMIAYDDEFLWIGARLFMKDASKIMATSKKRDDKSKSSDMFGIIIDGFNDNENAMAFYTMPTGARIDYTISQDASGGSGSSGGSGNAWQNLSWNTFWDVKTTRDDKGWYVEIRIPFSSLRFKPENNRATMGLLVNRIISSRNEKDTWPKIDPKYGYNGTSKPSLAGDIAFDGIQSTNPVYISPYVIGGFSRDFALNEEGNTYVKKDNPDFNAGLDVKYSINSNLTLDLTANTDFAQVEADDQQVNLTRYSLYFPEKRMFFQERSSLFQYNLGGSSYMFYSRNIGLSSEGIPVKIFGGARLVGRVGNWDLGVINMQTEKFRETPSENFGVFRMRRKVINDNSFVGGMFTSRLGMDGSHNFAYGVDGIIRVYGDDYLDVKLAQTYDSQLDNKLNSFDPTFFYIKLKRRSEKGFAYEVGAAYTGQEFNPGIGFVRQGSMKKVSTNLQYGWIPGAESKFYTYQANVRFSRFIRLEDGKLESMSISPGWELNTKSGFRYSFSVDFQQEGVQREYTISEKDEVLVNIGNYKFVSGKYAISTPSTKPISLSVKGDLGEFYDGYNNGIAITPYFNISSDLELTGSYQFNHISFPERGQEINIHSASGRVTYMLNTQVSASIYAQYISTTDDLISNFRLRYNPREGNDFYLVFNEYRNIGDSLTELQIPDYFNRTIMLKYTHTFRL